MSDLPSSFMNPFRPEFLTKKLFDPLPLVFQQFSCFDQPPPGSQYSISLSLFNIINYNTIIITLSISPRPSSSSSWPVNFYTRSVNSNNFYIWCPVQSMQAAAASTAMPDQRQSLNRYALTLCSWSTHHNHTTNIITTLDSLRIPLVDPPPPPQSQPSSWCLSL